MTLWTPGPWTIGGTTNPYDDPRQNVWGPRGAQQSGKLVAQHIRPADARLIAEAPEMADILTELVRLFAMRRIEVEAPNTWAAAQTLLKRLEGGA